MVDDCEKSQNEVGDNSEESPNMFGDLEPAAYQHKDGHLLMGTVDLQNSVNHDEEEYETLVRLSDVIKWIRGRREIMADNGRQRAQYAMLTLANELEEFTQKTGEEQ